MRLATKLLLAFGLLLLTAVSAVAFFAGRTAAREVGGELRRGGMLPISITARELAAYYRGNQSWDGVEEVFPSAGRIGGMMHNGHWLLLDTDGTVLADTEGRLLGRQFTPGAEMESVPIRVSGHIVGSVIAFEVFPPAPEINLVTSINRALFMAALLTGAAGLAIALILSRNLTAPLRRLSDAMLRFARGERRLSLPAPSGDEVGDLTRSFQNMAREIERQEDLRREMTADIAHELRNPLSVMRANLEALADGVYPLTREELDTIRQSAELLSRLVNDLHTLALADAGQLRMEQTDVNIPALLRRVAARYQPPTGAPGPQIAFVTPGALPELRADPQRLEQILGNLLHNATRLAPDQGRILLSAGREADVLWISVEDSGPGIPPDALDRIFERFYRTDTGRTRTEGGSGLGLAIAKKLAEAQGGTITAENRAEGGARFMLRFPILVIGPNQIQTGNSAE